MVLQEALSLPCSSEKSRWSATNSQRRLKLQPSKDFYCTKTVILSNVKHTRLLWLTWLHQRQRTKWLKLKYIFFYSKSFAYTGPRRWVKLSTNQKIGSMHTLDSKDLYEHLQVIEIQNLHFTYIRSITLVHVMIIRKCVETLLCIMVSVLDSITGNYLKQF